MQIDKQQVLSMIEQRLGPELAKHAAGQLPDKVDSDEHGGLLQQLGVNPQELFGGNQNQTQQQDGQQQGGDDRS